MPANVGEKVHYMRRRLFKEQPKRHVIGEIVAIEYGILRVRSILFMGSQMTGQYVRVGERVDRFVTLLDSLTLVTILPPDFDLEHGNVVVEQGKTIVSDGRYRMAVDQQS